MQPEEPDLNNPAYWLSKSPDRMVLSLISTIYAYWQLVNTLLFILKSDPNTKEISLQGGSKLSSLLEGIELRHKQFHSNFLAASDWIEAYRKGQIDLEPYRSPYDKPDDEQDK